MAEDFSHTISGLLKKRSMLQIGMSEVREQLAVISNDIVAIDKVLDSLGYDGELENKIHRTARTVLFYRNELSRFILDTLRENDGPMSSRDIAEKIIEIEGKSQFDRSMMADIVKRVGRSCQQLRDRGIVRGWKDESKRYVWELE